MFDDESWELFRAEALAYAKERDETLIKSWLHEIKYTCKDPIGYYICLSSKTIELYSTRPGILIGRAGINIEILKDKLTKEYRGDWKVEIKEIRGGFVTI